ncbi:NAD-dependent epimerase/dehydratase family protein [Atopomonas sediminilitoris]|uniref:NAD-dependent epimerase/dehydratase family protein n=1 Tax=Atopomonas sediminilitoris TaxID=2919919 RepID=UPI001F4E2806|nr:NAD-dependent epimerase/dehydratase family protein [Atopomonas sediminilitoris]MCJ8168443.1 NAD-dependent epimerase/dehydratase family protein [Atopomonas sediminilitoris]
MSEQRSNEPRILVTGGAGFIGSHLVDLLLSQGFAVTVLDNLSFGHQHNLPLDNPKLRFIQGDVADATVVAEAVQGCQAIAHLAAVASVQASVDDPLGTHQANLVGTVVVAEAAKQAGIKRIVFASSAAVYGNNGEGVAIDEDTPKAPLTPYAADKLASEHYLDFYRREHGLTPAIFRFFNIYGPRQDPSSPYSGVISIFTERTLKQQPITVFGDGEQTRDFVFVADLVALLAQALHAEQVPVAAVNVGLQRSTSLNQLLGYLREITASQPSVTYAAGRPGDIRHSLANNQRLRQCYAFAEPVPMLDGLRALVASVKA